MRVFYYLFDLLHLDGKSTIEVPLLRRKRLLGRTPLTSMIRCVSRLTASRTASAPTGPHASAATRES